MMLSMLISPSAMAVAVVQSQDEVSGRVETPAKPCLAFFQHSSL